MYEKINGVPVDQMEYWTWKTLRDAPELGRAGCGAIAQALGLTGALSVRVTLTQLVKKGLVSEHEGMYTALTGTSRYGAR